MSPRAKLTIKRPDGTIETVDSNFDWINDLLFGKIVKATREAGRGDVLSVENPPENAPKTGPVYTMRQHYAMAHANEHREVGRCPRCGGYCDGDCHN